MKLVTLMMLASSVVSYDTKMTIRDRHRQSFTDTLAESFIVRYTNMRSDVHPDPITS